LLVKAFEDAMEEGRRLQGEKVAKWSYGQFNRLRMIHPVGGQLPSVGKYFNIGPVENNGSSTSVKAAGSGTFGPSMRMIADPGDWERSLLNLPTGESGHVLSGHYKDQWKAYRDAWSFPMQFRAVEAKNVLTLTPQ